MQQQKLVLFKRYYLTILDFRGGKCFQDIKPKTPLRHFTANPKKKIQLITAFTECFF